MNTSWSNRSSYNARLASTLRRLPVPSGRRCPGCSVHTHYYPAPDPRPTDIGDLHHRPDRIHFWVPRTRPILEYPGSGNWRSSMERHHLSAEGMMKVWVTIDGPPKSEIAVHTSLEATFFEGHVMVYGPFEISDRAPNALRGAAQVCAEVIGCGSCAQVLHQLAEDWEHR